MEHFAQTNVFVGIWTVFARIWTVFAHLIIGCTTRYPKIDNLCYIGNTTKHFSYKGGYGVMSMGIRISIHLKKSWLQINGFGLLVI